MKVSRVAGALGAEVTGIDVSASLADGSLGVIRDLLNEHEVLFLEISVLRRVNSAIWRGCSVHFRHIRPTVRSMDCLKSCC